MMNIFWGQLFVVFSVFYLNVHAIFDQQPKILTEDGNLVFESGADRNITFRIKGNGYLNVNDINLLKMITNELQANGTSAGSTLAQILDLQAGVKDLFDRFTNNELAVSRLYRLLNRTNLVPQSVPAQRLRNAIRRIGRLETKVDQLITKLSEDNCRGDPCQNGGTCIDLYDGYLCKCPSNWEGATCSQDVNECANFLGTDLGCQNGATCINSMGGYSCLCDAGWKGLHCTKRNADCLTSGADLCGHGTCVQTKDVAGYTCICDQGWKADATGPACTADVNECLESNPHCSMDPPVQCINLPGSFMCGLCPAGYTGNGHYCQDINECDTNNGGCSTSPSVNCINTRGSYHCSACPSGWQGDGKICTRTVTTDCSSPGVCHPLARCIQSAYGPNCVCPIFYTGNGFGPMGCILRSSDPCLPNPCHSGTCIKNGTSFICNCPANTLKPLCTVNAEICSTNPCKNNGTCSTLPNGGFTCTCPANFKGALCENEELTTCGRVLTGESGTLKYPPMDNYPHNSRCAWVIRTNITKVLNVTFTKFNIEDSQVCRFDWLQIHDGRSSAANLIGRFCGTTAPLGGNIVSTHNTLYLWFRSDNFTAREGFELNWHSIDPVCGGMFEITQHGTINSPGSPGNYPINRDCEWHLSAPYGKRIQFHFFTMQLETHINCEYDYLAIYSGSNTEGPLIDKFCNTTHPEPLTTPGNEALLHFHSDGDSTDAGFQIHYSVIEGFPGCGGTYTADSGEFGPPMEDGAYTKNVNCEYLIKLPPNNKIKISFKEFDLEEGYECNFDSITIYEGSSQDDPLVNTYCGSTIPLDYVSLGNQLLIVFKSDWSIARGGFRIKYEIVCGGKYQDESGIVTSPLYPNEYHSNRKCLYDIIAPLGKAIVLDFQDFDLEDNNYYYNNNGECLNDYVEIIDGHDENSTKIGKYCGTNRPGQAVSTHNNMLLNFQSDYSISGRGFKANYSLIDSSCGGIIKEIGHTIEPPKTDGRYNSDMTCKWTIVSSPNNVVQLTFSSFNLEESYTSGCAFDQLKIIDGLETSPNVIGTYCGTTLPPIITSSSNVLTLIFKSDYSFGLEGFTLTYAFQNSANSCGGFYHTPTGTIKSPGYPSNYPPFKHCDWVLNVPQGKRIELNITAFELEDSTSCQFDYVAVRNGGSADSPLIGQFCGDTITNPIVSFTNKLFIQFVSDSSRSYSGFLINWSSELSGCGGSVNNIYRGSISSPNYPLPYSENAQCDWRISVNPGSLIQIVFTELSLEEGFNCGFDSLEIFDGSNAAAKTMGMYCSNENAPHLLSSTSNHLFLRLKSDISNQGKGFHLIFQTVCKREMRDHRGSIESPNFPNIYPNNIDCEWTIIAPKGNKILVTFSQFQLEPTYVYDSSSTCDYDYLEIIEKNVNDEIVKSTKHCSEMPKQFTSISEKVVFKFKTDISAGESGFHLEYEMQGCGNHFTHPTGSFSTPNYPNAYPKDIHCDWVITTDYGNIIELTFIDFDFELSDNCTKDGLIVSNSKNESHPLSKFCGKMHSAPAVITSNGHELYVSFFSFLDGTTAAGKGFSATYRSKALACGGHFNMTNGRIISPNYPNNYKSNSYCEWFVTTQEAHRLKLNFVDFSVEEGSECVHDFVEIYDGFDKMDEKRLLMACGNVIPNATFESTGNKMLIIMQTDNSFEAKGFDLSYHTACGGTISTNSSGKIELSGKVMTSSAPNETCTFTISTENLSQHVTLTIKKLHNSITTDNDGSQCIKKIAVYDGDSTHLTALADICSNPHPPPVTSNGNALTITFENAQLANMADFEFEAEYTVMDNSCGGKFGSKIGHIASPNYPKAYPTNVECEWRILATSGNQIKLRFLRMSIVESENCNDDYVEIHEKNVPGKLLGVFCGNTIPETIVSSSNLWIKFRSGSDDVDVGFLAEYSYVTDVEIAKSTGTIESPLYPYLVYDIDQSYRIMVELGKYISLSIVDAFFQQTNGLDIYDGYDESAPKLSTISDMSEQSAILSSTNVFYIVCKIPFNARGKFKVDWVELSDKVTDNTNSSTETLNCTESSLVTVPLRGLIVLQSPGYPTGYDTNLNCVWNMVPAEPGYHVAFSYRELDLEDVQNCVADYVMLSSSRDMVEFKELHKWCKILAQKTSILYEGTPNLKLQFVSDYYTNRTGFSGFVTLLCGGPLTGPSGVLTSTKIYSNNDCDWEITVRPGRTIQFTFEQLNFPKSPDGTCRGHVLIRNGHTKDSPFLGQGKYCGTEIPVINQTSSNRAFVTFSNFLRLGLGMDQQFTLKYQEVSFECGDNLIFSPSDRSKKEISSPRYPQISPAHVECVWTVFVPNGELIRIDFVERFDIRLTDSCALEYVEIRDGGTASAREIGTFCGPMPSTQYSTTNMLRIKYFTDADVPMNGFKARISIAKCGGFYRSPTGLIKSTNYPSIGSYDSHSICEYRIYGTNDISLNITFTDLDLPGDIVECDENSDHIKIFNILPSDSNATELDQIGIYCGQVIPEPIVAGGSEVLVQFITKEPQNQYRGFRISYTSNLEKCGGNIKQDSGIISSPGYPKGRQFRQYCEWRITVTKGQRIKVNILDFDVATSVSAAFGNRRMFDILQRITFYNDHSYLNRIKFLNANNSAEPIYSSDNLLLVSMWLRRNTGHRGFKFNFSSDEPTICQGNLNGLEGQFDTPKENVYYCEYERSNSDSSDSRTLVVQLIEKSNATQYCLTGSHFPFSIKYTANPVSTRNFYKICNNRTSIFEPIATIFNDTKLIFRQGAIEFFRSNYTVQYKQHNCGGFLKGSALSFSGPQFASNYGKVGCAWQYTSIEGMTVDIQVNFTNLDCEKEYIYVYNGPTPSSPRLKRICGIAASTEKMIGLHNHQIYFEYHSSAYNPNTTFSVAVSQSYEVCGGSLNAPMFKFKSPVNGTNYPNNVECIYDINAGSGYHVGLVFKNRFFIEDSINCTRDYVEIFDKVDGQFVSLGRVCGRALPKPFNSTGPHMRVIFHTDDNNIVGDGFTIRWSQNCGGVIRVTEQSQSLSTPGYPERYPRNAYCNYTLVTDLDKYINLQFFDMDFEDSTRSCSYDNLTIYQYVEYLYPNPGQALVGTYCWKDSLKYLRYKHKVNLIFMSDEWVERKGFKLNHYLDTCGGTITNSTKIELPTLQHSNQYVESLNCVWNISAPDDQKIVIRFEMFELEYAEQCYLDSVEIYKGVQILRENRKAQLCGNLTGHAPVINIGTSKGVLKFSSDLSNNYKGFSALIMFSAACDKVINLNEKTQSYDINQIATSGYASNLDCHYSIDAPKGYVLSLQFTQFHIAPCQRTNSSTADTLPCSCDFVEVRDGFGELSEIIETVCGQDRIPNTIVSSKSSLFVRFVTDSIDSSTGFLAKVKMEASVCGPTYLSLNDSTHQSTQLKWPLSGSKYLPNTKCSWIVEVPISEQISIEFEKLDIEYVETNNDCTSDFLKITDSEINPVITEGLNSETVFAGGKYRTLKPNFGYSNMAINSPHIYCGHNARPTILYSSSSKVEIVFESDSDTEFSGFILNIKQLKACQHNFTSDQGRIFSRKIEDCESYITASPNTTISFYFSNFYYYPSPTDACSEDTAALRIFNGEPNGKLISYHCYGVLPTPVFTNTSNVVLRFRHKEILYVDNLVGAYDITYIASDKGQGCGGQIYNYAGTFSSPMYPNNDRNNSDCRWDITVPQNLKVSLEFSIFDLGPKATCSSDYVQIIETNEQGEETVARQYCGDDVPSQYKGPRNTVAIRFKKTMNFAGTGWSVKFMSIMHNAEL